MFMVYIVKFNVTNLLICACAVFGSDGGLNFPGPATFSAQTLKIYVRPSKRPSTFNSKSGTMVRLTLAQCVLLISRFSTQYPSMGLPLSLGSIQVTHILLAVTSLISGFSGASGGSELTKAYLTVRLTVKNNNANYLIKQTMESCNTKWILCNDRFGDEWGSRTILVLGSDAEEVLLALNKFGH